MAVEQKWTPGGWNKPFGKDYDAVPQTADSSSWDGPCIQRKTNCYYKKLFKITAQYTDQFFWELYCNNVIIIMLWGFHPKSKFIQLQQMKK